MNPYRPQMETTQQQFLRKILARKGMTKAVLAKRLDVLESVLEKMLVPVRNEDFVELSVVQWIKAKTTQQEYLRDVVRRLGMTRAQFAERISTPIKTVDKWMLPADSTSAAVMANNLWRFVSEVVEREAIDHD